MRNNTWIIAGVIVVLLLSWIGYLLFWPISDAKQTADGGTKTGVVQWVDATILVEKDALIKTQENLITELKDQITEKDQQIADLIKTCTGKTVYLKAKNTGNSGGGNTTGNSGNVKPVNTGNNGGNSGGINKEPEAEYLTQQNSVPKSKVRIEINEQKFCIRLGDLFWPHLAVNLGEEFSEIVDNGIGGFDLYILPAGTVGSNPKGYGITEDFTFWIKKSRLTSWPETPYFLNKSGIFVKGQESGEYWIAK